MSNENIYDGITGIREDIVQKAENYQFKKLDKKSSIKKVWIKWCALAACVCLIVGITVPTIYNSRYQKSAPEAEGADEGFEEGTHSGLQTVENPVYEVMEYTVPDQYVFSTLYIATTDETESYDQHMVSKYGSRFQDKGIRVFTFVEGAENPELNVWYLVYEGEHISKIYFTTKSPKSDDKYVTGWIEAGEVGRVLEALSEKTSKEEPMYLVQDSEILYAIIGKTAYYLPVSVFEPEVSHLPEIDLDGLDVKVLELNK